MTRVTFTVPLREHFSLPFIFLHYLLAGRHLRAPAPAPAPATLLGLYVSGVLFTVSWQFAQFVLLIQALVLFVLGTVGLLGELLLSLLSEYEPSSSAQTGTGCARCCW